MAGSGVGAESWRVSCALILELSWRLCLAEVRYSYSVKFRKHFMVSGCTQSPNSSPLAALLVKKDSRKPEKFVLVSDST